MDKEINTIEYIMRHPKHLDFFREVGYVKYSGASVPRLNIKPKVKIMLPIDLSDGELIEEFYRWQRKLKK